MPVFSVQYGAAAPLRLEFRPAAEVTVCAAPAGEPLANVRQAVVAALNGPVELPPLMRALVPGDHVALALGAEVPCAPQVVAGAIDVLLAAGIQPQDISLVSASSQTRSATSLLGDDIRARLRVETHLPHDSSSLAYVAATRTAEPLYLNRTLFEADVLLPLGCLHPPGHAGYFGLHGDLYPAFSTAAMQDRFHAGPRSAAKRGPGKRRLVREASWLIGPQFTLQAIPGVGDNVLHVLAGSEAAVRSRGAAILNAAWVRSAPQRAEVVIAALGEEAEAQTWRHVAQALAAAQRCVQPDGTIVLCTSLRAAPPKLLTRAVALDDLRATRQLLRRDATADGLMARAWWRAALRARLYLLGELPAATVEACGMSPLATAADVVRLVARAKSCIVIENAQETVVRVPTTAEAE